MVTSKRKFDFEGSYLKRLGESIALRCIFRPHKVRLETQKHQEPDAPARLCRHDAGRWWCSGDCAQWVKSGCNRGGTRFTVL